MSPLEVDPDEVRECLNKLALEKPRFDFKSDRFPRFDGGTEFKPAAVLIPFTETDEGMEIVLTQRSAELRKHAGQVSFPGGKRDPEDASLIETALRESHEEIALVPDDVTVFGALLSMPTVTGYDVTVYAGEFHWPYELEPNPAEIDTLFKAPLAALADPSIHRLEERMYEGETFPIHYFDYGDQLVWGATGFMLDILLQYLNLRS